MQDCDKAQDMFFPSTVVFETYDKENRYGSLTMTCPLLSVLIQYWRVGRLGLPPTVELLVTSVMTRLWLSEGF